MEDRISPGLGVGMAPHGAGLGILLASAWAAWIWLGRVHPIALGIAISIPVAHQVFVWLAWRLELRARSVSRTIGYPAYLAIFFVLLGARPVSILALAWLDHGTLGLEPVARGIVTGALLVPAAYAMYSVVRYFGLVRAAGADHFDPRYREMPLERRGIFRFTSNGMYTFAFLGLWAIATGFDSRAALIAAGFNHAYIWVHYVATERPDLRYLYADSA